MNLTVMTANLRVNVASDKENAWPHRVLSMADVFHTHRPVIAGTQEGLGTMLNDTLRQLPEYAFVGQAREVGNEGEHCAIFYRKSHLSVQRHGQFWLSETPDVPSTSWNSACPRICTWGVFEFMEHPTVTFAFFNTHLDHVSQKARERGVELILQRIEALTMETPVPVILTGDMNAEPSNRAIQTLRSSSTSNMRDVYVESNQAIRGTFHGFREDAATVTEAQGPIDYIFVSPELSVEQVRIDDTKHLGRWPSDHYPVIATLAIKA